jgi:endoglucanase
LALGAVLAFGARADEANNWARYKAAFIAPDGRLFDESAENVSHSEGQGYALTLAAFHDDREAFAKIWAWTAANLEIRGDHLAAWRWRPQDAPHVLDRNNATDGDLLIAWGLAEAGRRWKAPEYTGAARRIAFAIAAKVVFPSGYGPALRPGAAGFGEDDTKDGPLVNLSYWVFPALDALAEVAPEVDWKSIERSGLKLFDAARFGTLALPCDWISLRSGVRPAQDREALFSYELVRAPLYLAWGPELAKPALIKLTQAWLGASGGSPTVIDVDKGVITQNFDGLGYRAVAALARCAADGAKFPDELRELRQDGYYSATLQMLSLTALRVRYPQC